jgi:hypothetical protein
MFPDNPPSFIERIAMGYHDIVKIRADLARAGFMETKIDTLALPCRADSARDIAFGLVQGTPAGAEVTERDPAGLDKVVEAATLAIAERFGPGPVQASMQAHIVMATRSS